MDQKYVCATDRAVYVPFFEALERLLDVHNKRDGFNTSTGARRHDVKANEFMYMCHSADGKEVQFKHHFTRNYVYLRGGPAFYLVKPETANPFNRGQFDKEPDLTPEPAPRKLNPKREPTSPTLRERVATLEEEVERLTQRVRELEGKETSYEEAPR